MANFPTHIVVGTVVAGSLATLTLAADVIAPENLVAVTMAGSLGSVLPDIEGATGETITRLASSGAYLHLHAAMDPGFWPLLEGAV